MDFQEKLERLKPKHREVLRLIANGYGNPEIGEKLNLGKGTADTLVRDMYWHLGLHSRCSLTVFALKAGLVQLEELELR